MHGYRVSCEDRVNARVDTASAGFATVAVVPDGYAPGLDRREMRLEVHR